MIMNIENLKQSIKNLIYCLNSSSLFILGSGVSIRYASSIEQTKSKIQLDKQTSLSI